MDISTTIKKLKLVLSEKKLNNLGRDTGFMKRMRNVSSFQLVIAMIGALGEKDTRYLSDILRYFNQLTGQSVKYKPFHNQLAKLSLAELMRQVAEKVISHWINNVLKSNKSVFVLFKQINIHDGSLFSVHRGLKDL